MGKGEFAALSLQKKRTKWRKKDRRVSKKLKIREGNKGDLLAGSPQAKGIVLEKEE